MRMPRYDIRNEGAGPYAVFYCDKCSREFQSQITVHSNDVTNVGRTVLEGLLRNIPVVGYDVANNVQDPRYMTTMTADQLQHAWQQVAEFFHECPTCRRIVCVSDWDANSGYCKDDRPRAPKRQRRQGGSTAVAAAARQCPNCHADVPAGTNFCTNCGTPLAAPPRPAVCPNCGSEVIGHFCGNCGTRID
jgi:rubrerythrin